MRPTPVKFAEGRRTSRGVVLIVAMFLLIVLSLIAVASIRGTSSTELSVNNSRSQALAMQAAEAALRYCEKGAISAMLGSLGAAVTITPDAAPASATADYYWSTPANWDAAITGAEPRITILPQAQLNNRADDSGKLYKRMPECMVQFQFYATPNRRAVITARGFGPEVPVADIERAAPKGSEVWLQSIIQLD